jgi:AraC-like DNA-binding protein
VSQAPIALGWDINEKMFEVWQEQVCEDLLAADPGMVRPERVEAKLRLNVLPGRTVTLDADVRYAGLGIIRSRDRIAREKGGDVIGLSVVMRGSALVRGEAGDRIVQTGDVAFFTSGEAFEKTMSADYREFFLYLPLDYLSSIGSPRLEGIVPGIAPRTPLGRVLAGTLASTSTCAAALGASDWPPVLRSVVELAAATFQSDAEQREVARPAARAYLRGRALGYIDEHLADPALSPPTIAAALGTSLRYLHLLFEGTDQTVAATILARRLDRCRAELSDPRSLDRSVSEIGFAWGFNDAAHFSRAFKARFGLSPRDLRPTRAR